MTASEGEPAPDPFNALLAFKGSLSSGKYFIGLAVALLFVIFALGFFASVMNPTGGGAPFMAVPMLLIYLYIHAIVTVARLRDAGRSPWLALLFIFGPFIFFASLIEFLEASEAAWGVAIAGFLGFYILPGLMRRKDEVQPAA